MLNNSLVYEKAFQFAIRIVKAYRYLQETHKEFVMSKQLLRSGTSIGANIAEANGAISDADFSSKMSIDNPNRKLKSLVINQTIIQHLLQLSVNSYQSTLK